TPRSPTRPLFPYTTLFRSSDSGGLMNPPGYSSMLRGKVEGSRFELRLELVRYAQEHGIREAARAFRASRNTVRLWLRRYEAGGRSEEHTSELQSRENLVCR